MKSRFFVLILISENPSSCTAQTFYEYMLCLRNSFGFFYGTWRKNKWDKISDAFPCLHFISSFKSLSSSDLNFGCYIGPEATTAANKIGVLSKARQYFTLGQLQLYQAEVRSCMEYCCHLWGGSAKYQLATLDAIENRAKKLIGDSAIVEGKLQSLEHRQKVACLSVFYRIHFKECNSDAWPTCTLFSFLLFSGISPICHDIQHFASTLLMRTTKEWNSLSSELFPAKYNIDLFKARVNRLYLGKHAPPSFASSLTTTWDSGQMFPYLQ